MGEYTDAIERINIELLENKLELLDELAGTSTPLRAKRPAMPSSTACRATRSSASGR